MFQDTKCIVFEWSLELSLFYLNTPEVECALDSGLTFMPLCINHHSNEKGQI